jgi:exopolysaccharide biosynthesis WecB/TagA/CpsF family protein
MQAANFLSFDRALSMDTGYLVTVNMQHLYECRRNADLRGAIFSSDKAKICLDGRGAQIVFQRLIGKHLPRAVGNELLGAKLSRLRCSRVLIIGSSREVVDNIKLKYPAVDFLHDDSIIPRLNRETAKELAILLEKTFGSDFALVALALGVPKQEILAQELNKVMPSCPIYCVGGSFEMLSGKIKRAPSIIQKAGLEGLWRFLLQPNSDRLKRILESYFNFCIFVLHPHSVRDLLRKREEDL